MRSGLRVATVAAAVALFALGMAGAFSLRWVCDDSFISLRYADNLVNGDGLVYNAGERVEGYTNLLWTLLLAGERALGIDEIVAAQAPGLAAYAALVAGLALWARRRTRERGAAFFPFAACVALVSHDFHVWATGGLETMTFTALVAGGLATTRAGPPSAARALGAGTLLALATLARPDGMLFAAAGAASWVFPAARRSGAARGRGLRAAAVTLAPLAVVLAIWIPWKLWYYGELFPTAFHAKSVLRPYVGQGVLYVGLYFAVNWFWLAALGPLAWARRARPVPTAGQGDDVFFLAAALSWIVWVVYIGGDFMFARHMLPSLPLLLLALEERLVRIPAPRVRVAVAAGLVLAAALPAPIYRYWPRINGIADERAFYPPETIEARRRQGEAAGAALAGVPVRAAFEGGMVVFGYYSRLPYLVEATGLTQYALAKQPLAERGFIGHEKGADDAWLAEHGVALVFQQALPPIEPEPGPARVDRVVFDDLVEARLVFYSDTVMDPLRDQPGVSFVPIERVLAEARGRIESGPLEEAEAILAHLEGFYFRNAGDPAARAEAARLRAVLERRRNAGAR